MAKKNRPSIGFEFYKEFIDKNLYYVDKTLLIRDLFEYGSKVNLFTRPRRFGKTLALTMLKAFFEQQLDADGNIVDNSHYFEGKKILEAKGNYARYMGQYPVIFLTLKSAKQPSFDDAFYFIKIEISDEFKKHSYILRKDILTEDERLQYQALMEQKANQKEYAASLKFLSKCLYQYHGKNTVILLDEYDVPLENSYFRGFYSEMTDFIRSLFESAFKTNDYLELAVITGCLRISKESIFTGLNNLKIVSVLNQDFAESFGFVQEEVEEMLQYFDMAEKMEEVKKWYNGYLFGETEVYNPWSVMSYVETAYHNRKAFPKPYWSNTSSNGIVRELVEEADAEVKKEIEILMDGGTLEKPIHEEITYGDIHESQDNLWNFLFFTGYLKKVSERGEGRTAYLSMTIPNEEIKYIYENMILTWFRKKVKKTDLSCLFTALDEGDEDTIGDFISTQLLESISFYDYAENYYHGFLTGLLKCSNKYQVYSNREKGNGRPDIVMKTPSMRGGAIILELKAVKKFQELEAGCRMALEQIEKQNYEAGLRSEGYSRILKYGISFYKKDCLVMFMKDASNSSK